VSKTELETKSQAELIKLVQELLTRVTKLELENNQLRTELEALKRKQTRTAAPFSRNKTKKKPLPPGRKPGIGVFKNRSIPTPEEITNTINVPAPLNCPKCGNPTQFQKFEFAYITELPIIKPSVTKYELDVKYCPVCKLQIRAEHPDLSQDQRGATAHRLGSRVIAAGLALQYGFGITARKVPAILEMLTKIRVTQSAFTQQAVKQGNLEFGIVGLKYKSLREAVEHSDSVNTDDTSWWLAGKSAFLMGFKTNSSVVYQIREQHRAIEVSEIIPSEYAGVLVTDRFVSYDARIFKEVKQQKCVAHILKNIRGLLEKPRRGRSHEFLLALRTVFKNALRLHNQLQAGLLKREKFDREGCHLTRRLDRLLELKSLSNEANVRLQSELLKHHARGSLLRFLVDPSVSPTNNSAERALRSAVISRKLSAGSKTVSGATAFSAFKSVIETGKLASVDGFNTLLDLYANAR
jgi:hypothetical protein